MPIGGSVNFLLGIERPIIYCLEYPLLKKRDKNSEYGRYLYKIGIATRGVNRLNTYLTYYPLSFVINYVIVMPKGSMNLKDLQLVEKYLFSLLKSQEYTARPFDQTVRMNRAINKLVDDSREFWEVDEKDLEKAFKKTKEFIINHFKINAFLVRPEEINEYYRLIARRLPRDIKMTPEEKEKNEKLIVKTSKRAREMIEMMPEEQKDMFDNPGLYFEIDKRFDKNYKK